MTCLGIIAFLKANSTTLLAMWVVFENYLASSPKIKANSTLQLLVNLANAAFTARKN
jgi:hypothetical protein